MGRRILLIAAAWLFLGAVAQAQETGRPEAAEEPQAPQSGSSKTPLSLQTVFGATFKPEDVVKIGPSPSDEDLARHMSDDQRRAARRALDAASTEAATARDKEILARGYLLLSDPQGALSIASRLHGEDPKSGRALTLAAEAYLQLGDRVHAADAIAEARRLDPEDDDARRMGLLLKDKRIGQAMRLPADPFDSKAAGRARMDDVKASAAAAGDLTLRSTPVFVPSGAARKDPSWPSALTTAGCLTLGAVGTYLLFGGLLAPWFESQWPNIRRDMGIAAIGAAVVASILILSGMAGKRLASIAARESASVAEAQAPAAVAQDLSADAANANKLHHVFGKGEHNLSDLVRSLGGERQAFEAIERATQETVQKQGISGVFRDLPVNVGGQTIRVRGRVIDGVARISTAFKP